MNKYERLRIAAALEKARPRIKSGAERFICCALTQTGNGWAGNYVMDQLNRRQGGAFICSYENWVARLHPRAYERMRNINRMYAGNLDSFYDERNPFTAGRLQWIDHMIKELRA